MSLKPDKKSDKSKSWMRKRSSSTRYISPEYHLIVTEGTKTEPEYFNSLSNFIKSKYGSRINVQICGEGKNTTLLFEATKKYVQNDKNGLKHIWIVYDTDDFPSENVDMVKVLCEKESCSKNTYHAIWSNQCFEIWYLLHFCLLQSNINRSGYYEKLDEYLENMGFGKYRKNRKDMFELLHPMLNTAILNAKKLDEKNKSLLPSRSAPGTQVYKILEYFLQYS